MLAKVGTLKERVRRGNNFKNCRLLMKLLFALFLLVLVYYGSLFWSFSTDVSGWQVEESSPIPRFEGPGALVNDRLYTFFGYKEYLADSHTLVATNNVSSLDLKTMKWSTHAPSPFIGTHLNAAVDRGLVYFVGGFEGNHPGPAVDYFSIYDSETDTWTEGPALPEKRGGGALVKSGRYLHYIGGYFAAMEEPSSEDHWAINLDNLNEGWKKRAPLPVSRGHAGTVSLNGVIYIIGGSFTHHPSWIDTTLVHRYNPHENSWDEAAALPYPLSHIEPGTFVHNDLIYVAGGRNGDSGCLSEHEVDDILAYDAGINKWSLVEKLPVPLRAPVFLIHNKRAIVTTGSTHWAQNPIATTWSKECCDSSRMNLKLITKILHKEIALKLPFRLQKWLGLKSVAGLNSESS